MCSPRPPRDPDISEDVEHEVSMKAGSLSLIATREAPGTSQAGELGPHQAKASTSPADFLTLLIMGCVLQRVC